MLHCILFFFIQNWLWHTRFFKILNSMKCVQNQAHFSALKVNTYTYYCSPFKMTRTYKVVFDTWTSSISLTLLTFGLRLLWWSRVMFVSGTCSCSVSCYLLTEQPVQWAGIFKTLDLIVSSKSQILLITKMHRNDRLKRSPIKAELID